MGSSNSKYKRIPNSHGPLNPGDFEFHNEYNYIEWRQCHICEWQDYMTFREAVRCLHPMPRGRVARYDTRLRGPGIGVAGLELGTRVAPHMARNEGPPRYTRYDPYRCEAAVWSRTTRRRGDQWRPEDRTRRAAGHNPPLEWANLCSRMNSPRANLGPRSMVVRRRQPSEPLFPVARRRPRHIYSTYPVVKRRRT